MQSKKRPAEGREKTGWVGPRKEIQGAAPGDGMRGEWIGLLFLELLRYVSNCMLQVGSSEVVTIVCPHSSTLRCR